MGVRAVILSDHRFQFNVSQQKNLDKSQALTRAMSKAQAIRNQRLREIGSLGTTGESSRTR